MSQQLLVTLKTLYAANGILGVSLYIPQIMRVLNDKKQAKSLSMVTFGGWSVGGFISMLYGLYYAHDLLFAALSVANMVAAGTMFVLVFNSKFPLRKMRRRFVVWRERLYRGAPQIEVGSEGLFMWIVAR